MNFFTDVIQKDQRFNSTERIADPELLEPVTRANVQAILSAALAMGIPCMLFETYRSQARQEMLFQQGATKLQKVGVHGYGLAADIVKVVNGEPSWEGDYSFLCKLAQENNMISGMDWGNPNIEHTFIDADHIQAITIARQDSLFAGDWYPELGYNPYKDG